MFFNRDINCDIAVAGRIDVERHPAVAGIAGARWHLAGIVIGVIGSLAITRAIRSLLFGVSPTDPLTFITVALLLVAVALLACWFPARRAAKVDPMVALRYE